MKSFFIFNWFLIFTFSFVLNLKYNYIPLYDLQNLIFWFYKLLNHIHGIIYCLDLKVQILNYWELCIKLYFFIAIFEISIIIFKLAIIIHCIFHLKDIKFNIFNFILVIYWFIFYLFFVINFFKVKLLLLISKTLQFIFAYFLPVRVFLAFLEFFYLIDKVEL